MPKSSLYQDELGVRIGVLEFDPGDARSADCSGPISIKDIGSATMQTLIQWKPGFGFMGAGLLMWNIFSGGTGFLLGAAAVGWGAYILFHPSKRSYGLLLVGNGGSDISRCPLKPYSGEKGKASIEAMLRAISTAKTAPPSEDVVVSVPESALRLQKAIAPTSTRLDTITNRLSDLRVLVGDHPEDADARQQLAKLLFTGMIYAKEEDRFDVRDALLEELRKVSQGSPEDAVAREQLAIGLGKTAEDVRTEDRPDRSDVLIHELRVQSSSHPEEAVLRNWLAIGLCGAIAFAKEQGRLDMRNALLDELRQLFRTHPQEPALAANYAKALVNDLVDADTENRLHLLPSVLEELRQTSHDFPQDNDVRKQLGLGLAFAIDNSVNNQNALLQELRLLAGAHPQQVDLRVTLAHGLAIAIGRAAHEKKTEDCESLLDELRQLVKLHPQEAVPRERFASSLQAMMTFYLESQGDSDAFDEILAEFRQMAILFPEDEDVRVGLGESLLRYISWSSIQDNEKFGDLMVELRELGKIKPENKAVWKMYHDTLTAMVTGKGV